eukprot:TRINITY_DN1585_c0_g1_i1.p1 TRINITY_DN1585_c0_g1~~TRINITY_DN1585_c0_g1_i1.p1  ORF type:complete len:205 (-),score=11.92 TRINITY_DN1585_c0_g1_i1:40-654(-)
MAKANKHHGHGDDSFKDPIPLAEQKPVTPCEASTPSYHLHSGGCNSPKVCRSKSCSGSCDEQPAILTTSHSHRPFFRVKHGNCRRCKSEPCIECSNAFFDIQWELAGVMRRKELPVDKCCEFGYYIRFNALAKNGDIKMAIYQRCCECNRVNKLAKQTIHVCCRKHKFEAYDNIFAVIRDHMTKGGHAHTPTAPPAPATSTPKR